MTSKMEEALNRLAAFQHLMERANAAATEASATDASGAVTVHVDREGNLERVGLDPLWKTKLGAPLGAAIMEAFASARGDALGGQAKIINDAPDRLADLELPPEVARAAADRLAESTTRARAQMQETMQGLTTQRIREATELLTKSLSEADRLLAPATTGHADDAEAAERTASEDNPVVATFAGPVLIGCDVDERWQRLVPADRAEDIINTALNPAQEG